jgi:hypothetical protein
MEATLKNKFTNDSKLRDSAKPEVQLSEYDILKAKYDRNALVAKKFPFEPEQFNYPEHALNIGNPLYMTANMDYGRLKPSGYEIHTRWFPKNNTFTKELPGGPYTNDSLRTGVTKNKVHDHLDGFN